MAYQVVFECTKQDQEPWVFTGGHELANQVAYHWSRILGIPQEELYIEVDRNNLMVKSRVYENKIDANRLLIAITLDDELQQAFKNATPYRREIHPTMTESIKIVEV